MTGQTIATCHWRALDREGDDTCSLAHADHGWLLIGHTRFRDDAGFAALDYVVRCDEGWHTLSADVAGLHEGREVSLRIVHDKDFWSLNGTPQPEVSQARDIDLSFTPATNLMPLRRLRACGQNVLQMQAAWLRYPQVALHPLDQTYGTEAGGVAYVAEQTGFTTRLGVDDHGFVTHYPGLWEGEVTHAVA